MTLVRKTVTPEVLRAHRANAAKATGPRTALGKCRSAMNAATHLIFARVITARMKEFGEDPRDFESLRESLFRAFAPRDAFEALLVEDMAQIRWRLLRLQRAESGILASQKRKFEIEREVKQAGEGGGLHGAAARALLSTYGISAMEDSPLKFARGLEKLRDLRARVESGGLSEADLGVLEMVYGTASGFLGALLKRDFKRYLQEQEASQADRQARNREAFLKELDEEIARFEKLEKLHEALERDLAEPMSDAQLVLADDPFEKVVRYEAALENRFERKLGQLAAWRMMEEGGVVTRAGEPRNCETKPLSD